MLSTPYLLICNRRSPGQSAAEVHGPGHRPNGRIVRAERDIYISKGSHTPLNRDSNKLSWPRKRPPKPIFHVGNQKSSDMINSMDESCNMEQNGIAAKMDTYYVNDMACDTVNDIQQLKIQTDALFILVTPKIQ
jgi:hypothetical protein